MLGQQLAIMPTVILSIVGAFLISRGVRADKGAGRSARLAAYGSQAGVAVLVSGLVGLAIPAMLRVVTDTSFSYWALAGFIWMASLSPMVLILGAVAVAAPLGAFIAAAVIPFGTAAGVVPAEALNAFWRDWVYPWVPQHFIGDGVRQVLFVGAGAWNPELAGLLWAGVAGLALFATACALPTRAAAAPAHAA